MPCVFQQQQRGIEKNLLSLGRGHAMFVVLPSVAGIPIEAFYLG